MLQLEAVTPAGRGQVHRASSGWTRDQVWCRLGQRENLVLSGPQCRIIQDSPHWYWLLMRPGWKTSPTGRITSKSFNSICSRDSQATWSVPNWSAASSDPCLEPGQDKDNPRKRLYKVFDRVEDVRGHETSYGSTLSGTARVQQNNAVRQALANSCLEKWQTSPLMRMICLGHLWKLQPRKRRPTRKGKRNLLLTNKRKKW